MPPFKIQESLGYYLNRCTILLRARLVERFKDRGIEATAEEWALLALVREHRDSPLSVNGLARLSLKDRTTVTRFLDRLEARRLLVRRPSPVDQRTALIQSTPEGAPLTEKMAEEAEALMSLLRTDIPKEDLEATLRTLKRIMEKLS